MNLSHSQGIHQSQGPLTSAHIAQTMTLLYMTSEELLQTIDQELSRNPALELINERRCPMCGRKLPQSGPCPICTQPKTASPDETIIFLSPRDDFYAFDTNGANYSNEAPEDPYASEAIDLPTYVLRQVAPELAVNEREIAAMILTNLDEDGFLKIEIHEICRFHHVVPSQVEKVRRKIMRCDPLGVGSKSIQEALQCQVDYLSETSSVPDHVAEIIEHHYDLLSKHQLTDLSRKLGISSQSAKNIVKYISENLNPFPARSSWGTLRQPTSSKPDVFHHPDVLIYYQNNKPDNPLIIEIITPSRGTLRLNPLFKKASKNQSGEKQEEWAKDIEKASLLIKCIQQRNNTMRQLMEKLAKIQKSFIMHGDVHLESLTRAEIANDLGVHESTISRAVSNKTVQLPNKQIIPMAKFFDRSLSVRAMLRDIIANENHALNDSELQNRLEEKGISVARRTVAKYRSMEGILPAHLRRIEKFATT